MVSWLRKFIEKYGKYSIFIWGAILVLIGFWGKHLDVKEIYMTFPRRQSSYESIDILIYAGVFMIILGLINLYQNHNPKKGK